jgi:hypothetical protein
MDDTGIIDSIEEVAKRFGKTVRTIYRWRDAGLPERQDGKFDFFEITAWRRKKKGISIPSGDSNSADVGPVSQNIPQSAGSKDIWDSKSKEMQAKLRELELRKRLGELIESKDNEEKNVRRILEVKDLLLSYELLLPPELILCRTDREMAEVIRRFNRKTLQKFVKYYEHDIPKRPDPDASDPNA